MILINGPCLRILIMYSINDCSFYLINCIVWMRANCGDVNFAQSVFMNKFFIAMHYYESFRNLIC
jgi:hypothetical protein